MKSLSKPFFIAGVQHIKASPGSVPPESILTIRHNPENPYDPFALEVYANDVMFGHIPRTDQAAWFYFTCVLDVSVQCRLVRHDVNKPPYEQWQVQWVCADRYTTTVLKVLPT